MFSPISYHAPRSRVIFVLFFQAAAEASSDKLIPRWYSNTIWVSEDPNPPTDVVKEKIIYNRKGKKRGPSSKASQRPKDEVRQPLKRIIVN